MSEELKFKELIEYVPVCKDYVKNTEGVKDYCTDGLFWVCEKRMKCANSYLCRMTENLKKVEG